MEVETPKGPNATPETPAPVAIDYSKALFAKSINDTTAVRGDLLAVGRDLVTVKLLLVLLFVIVIYFALRKPHATQ